MDQVLKKGFLWPAIPFCFTLLCLHLPGRGLTCWRGAGPGNSIRVRRAQLRGVGLTAAEEACSPPQSFVHGRPRPRSGGAASNSICFLTLLWTRCARFKSPASVSVCRVVAGGGLSGEGYQSGEGSVPLCPWFFPIHLPFPCLHCSLWLYIACHDNSRVSAPNPSETTVLCASYRAALLQGALSDALALSGLTAGLWKLELPQKCLCSN